MSNKLDWVPSLGSALTEVKASSTASCITLYFTDGSMFDIPLNKADTDAAVKKYGDSK